MWAAILCATKDNPKTDCKQLDDNVQAAIQAKDWLKSLQQ